MKNKKPIIFIALLIVACFVVGGTLAYYTSSSVFTNTFNTSPYQVLTQEEFASPDNWTPGDTTTKTIFATNKGNSPVAVRVKLTENWVDANGDPLPLLDSNDNPVVIINFSNGYENDWAYNDGYYYFRRALDKRQSTTPLIDSVTYNPDVAQETTNTCFTNPDTHKLVCTMAGTGYAGGKYTLKIDIETCQYNQYQNIWNVQIPVSEPIVIDGVLVANGDNESMTFGKEIERNSFESITMVDDLEVPNEAIDSWDASSDQNRSVMAWYKDADNDEKYELYIGQDGGVKANPDSSYAFANFKYVETMDLTNFDTTTATNMEFMFYNAGYNVSTFTTDLSGFNTSNVTNMRDMFRTCGYNSTSWSIGNLDNWDVSKVTNMALLFMAAGYRSTTWSVGDLSNWDISHADNIGGIFDSVGYSVSSLDISYIENWNPASATTINGLFSETGYNATTLNLGDLSNWDTSNVETMWRTFYYTGYNATTLDLSFLSGWNTGNVTNMSYMFSHAGYNSQTVNFGNVSGWDVSKVENMSYMFVAAFETATTVDLSSLSGWNPSSVTDFTSMFDTCATNVDTFTLNLSGWNVSSGTHFGYMFNQAGYYTGNFNVNLTGWNTSNAQYMHYMFHNAGYGAETWTVGNLSGWNTGNVTNMSNMFSYAAVFADSFNIGNIGSWNTGKVTNMSYMFCINGEYAQTWYVGDLSNWNVSNVTDMSFMFYDTGYEAETWGIGDLSNWDTRKVTNMQGMFYWAGIEAGTWNSIGTFKIYATNVKEMFKETAFANCTLNIYNRPSTYSSMFNGAATSGSGIVVNYTSSVTNIDNLVATKSSGSNVTKGSIIS